MTDTDRHIFEPAGRAVPYVDEGAGPALVLVPGKGIDPVHLGTLAHVIIEEDFRVVRIGTRGTAADTDTVTTRELAQDVVDVMDHLGIADAWVGGHAFGGTVARVVAREHHDRVNGVLLLAVEETPEDEPLAEGVPVLIIQGSDDQTTPPAGGERLRESAPGLVSLVTIEGAGHLFAATHAGETAAVIEDYLDWD